MQFGQMWWQKGLSVALSIALVTATTPLGALAEEGTGESAEPVAAEPVAGEAIEDEAVIEDGDEVQSVDEASVAAEDEDLPTEAELAEEDEALAEDVPQVSDPTPEEDVTLVAESVEEEPVLEPQNTKSTITFNLNDQWRSEDRVMEYTNWPERPENVSVEQYASYADWKFTLEEDGLVTLSVRAATADIEWFVYNTKTMTVVPEFKTTIQLAATEGKEIVESQAEWLEKGTYCVRVWSSYKAKAVNGKYNVKGSFDANARRNIAQATYNGQAGSSLSQLATKTYKGVALTPALKITWDGKELRPNTDYTIAYKDNIKAGMASIVVTGKGQYGDSSKTIKFKIAKRSVKKCKVIVPIQPWTGKAVKAKPYVLIGKNVLKLGTDYKIVRYKKNVNVGTAKLVIKGKGSLKGTRTIKFKIRYNFAENGAVVGYYAPGTFKLTRFVFKATNKELKKGRDYKLKVTKNNDSEKTYKMVGKGKYAGTTYFTFKKK